ncbi:MAG: metalloregulator ArsR/SmtB family transcription factor, partial [Actinobacteria bacterium]|nr:metalloregulator ArsR/SmtB family transcription factor [Actinomycetota bacterium]MBW3651493.1 metalloregulator ArsR/SmtB family transcription factor [Actinomycetota bacterium]
MVVHALSPPETDKLFHALADSTRRDIVGTVLTQEHSVSALARRYPMSFAAVQKHVAVLEEAGLVTKQRRGRESLVRGDIHRVRDAR